MHVRSTSGKGLTLFVCARASASSEAFAFLYNDRSPCNNKTPRRSGVFCVGALGALYVDGIRSFRRLFGLERNAVALAEVSELDSDETFAVEEQVFRHAFRRNESKALVSQLFDCSGHLGV